MSDIKSKEPTTFFLTPRGAEAWLQIYCESVRLGMIDPHKQANSGMAELKKRVGPDAGVAYFTRVSAVV